MDLISAVLSEITRHPGTGTRAGRGLLRPRPAQAPSGRCGAGMVDRQIVVDSKRAGHPSRSHSRDRLVAVAVHDAKQRDSAILHDDVNRIVLDRRLIRTHIAVPAAAERTYELHRRDEPAGRHRESAPLIGEERCLLRRDLEVAHRPRPVLIQ